ncbi:MAG TPA: hybrid sensor histidine kinase/response regulator [Anaerolineales bacterium]
METPGSILVIDDEEGIRKGCTRVLRPAGYTVETAAGFQDGSQKIRTGQFDLILLDVMMPDGKGIDLIEPIRERDPQAVIVLITGYATVELAVDAIKRGAYDFISKPFSGQLLLMTVRQGLEKRRLSIEADRLRSAEQQIAELKQAREQAERLYEFKSVFANTVAHELRSPLGAAQSLVRTVLRGLAGPLNPKQEELLGRVEARLDGLLKLVNDLLTLAASRSLAVEKPLQPVKLAAVIQRVLQSCKEEALGRDIALRNTPLPQDVSVLATEDGLETVLGNLVGNAVKYTPPGGSITVELVANPDCIQVRVVDTGIGIPEGELAHVGEEFFRATNARGQNIQGTGLGLSIVKELLQRFGARMNLKSLVGQGTTVALDFPMYKDAADPGR